MACKAVVKPKDKALNGKKPDEKDKNKKGFPPKGKK